MVEFWKSNQVDIIWEEDKHLDGYGTMKDLDSLPTKADLFEQLKSNKETRVDGVKIHLVAALSNMFPGAVAQTVVSSQKTLVG